MNKYELALVVSANVEEEVRNAVVEQVKELITRFDGTITDPGTCEKKKLAYEIQKMSEGFFDFIKFEAEGTCPAEVESRLRIMDNVLRFLIVKDGE
ncbi:MAG: 30S ribosomal protein S6 [Lachnospira sp.]|nr:30S ribosomal protein S6 [Lachnospira sp.]